MTRLFHVTTSREWAAAQGQGIYHPRGFAAEGFIHCSYGHQVRGVLDRFFVGQTSLVVLQIDRRATGSPVVDENLEGGDELFPHLYGPLPVAAVVAVYPVESWTDALVQTLRAEAAAEPA